MTESNEVVIYEGKDIQFYLDVKNERTKALAMQIKKFIPGIDQLPPEAQWAFSAICLAYDADPASGEAWAWMDNRGKPCMMFGIAHRRRKAREQLRLETGDHNADFTTSFERIDGTEYGCNADDFVYECKLYDSKSSQRWLKEFVELKKAGFESNDAAAIIGTRPFTLGVGICKKDATTKMEKNEAARKRAEANALKQRFDLRMPDIVSEISLDTGNSEKYANAIDAVSEPVKEQTMKQCLASLGFDDQPADDVITVTAEPEEEPSEPKPIEYPEWVLEVVNSKGVKYISLDTETLSHMFRSIEKSEPSDENEAKKRAITAILAARNNQ